MSKRPIRTNIESIICDLLEGNSSRAIAYSKTIYHCDLFITAVKLGFNNQNAKAISDFLKGLIQFSTYQSLTQ